MTYTDSLHSTLFPQRPNYVHHKALIMEGNLTAEARKWLLNYAKKFCGPKTV